MHFAALGQIMLDYLIEWCDQAAPVLHEDAECA